MTSDALITVSIVSHGHGTMVSDLLADLAECPEVAKVLLTLNVPEPAPRGIVPERLTIISNSRPKGFGANHNAAFAQAKTPFFAVLNPDIRLDGNPFPTLLHCARAENVGLCAPAVINADNELEDSARYFPTARDLLLKAVGRYHGRLEYRLGDPPRDAPWVAGMFMLFPSGVVSVVGGFDDKYYLYYEDVDLCLRLWQAGLRVRLCPTARVIHNAQRASRRNLRHMRWHLASIARYLGKWRRPGMPPVQG